MASSREKEDEMTLYYHPALYFSQRIALVLEEKGLKYKTKFVNSQTGEHMSQWYREINPQGEVPSISCNGYNVGDSERLLDYLDKVFPRTPRLQPPDYTSEGQKVRYWRSKINSIPVEFITLGCIMFRSKLTRGSSIPENVPRHLPDQIGLVRDHFRHQFRGHLHGAQTSDDDDDEETELDVYGTVVRDINNVREQIGVLDMVLEEIESELGKTRLISGTLADKSKFHCS
ncbi:ganglioside-induced differentiation-associated protein 1-like isoform X2 [Glandiceps talaboti]